MRVDQISETEDALAKLEQKIDAMAADVAAIRRQLLWQKVWGFIKVLVIVVPLVWATITLYPVVKGMYDQTQSIINKTNSFLPK